MAHIDFLKGVSLKLRRRKRLGMSLEQGNPNSCGWLTLARGIRCDLRVDWSSCFCYPFFFCW